MLHNRLVAGDVIWGPHQHRSLLPIILRRISFFHRHQDGRDKVRYRSGRAWAGLVVVTGSSGSISLRPDSPGYQLTAGSLIFCTIKNVNSEIVLLILSFFSWSSQFTETDGDELFLLPSENRCRSSRLLNNNHHNTSSRLFGGFRRNKN